MKRKSNHDDAVTKTISLSGSFYAQHAEGLNVRLLEFEDNFSRYVRSLIQRDLQGTLKPKRS